MFCRVKGIDADPDAHHADLHQVLGHPVIDHHAIGSKDHHEPLADRMSGDVQNIRTNQRFTAGDDQQRTPIDLGNLINKSEAFLRA